MNKAPTQLGELNNTQAIARLCTFGESLANEAGRITPSQAGFSLELNGRKRAKHIPNALRAVKALRKANTQTKDITCNA